MNIKTTRRPTLPGGMFLVVLIATWFAASAANVSAAGDLIAADHAGARSVRQYAPDEPKTYRLKAYLAPTPNTLNGASAVSTDEAMALWKSNKIIFIDVLPRPPRPKQLGEGTIWRPKKRQNIPNSVWLANVGFGVLNPELEAYFRNNLAALTHGDKATPILIYCLADCWMSWNAAKRAVAFGYKSVYWYPEGTDGWSASGGRLERSEPMPTPPRSN